MSTAKIRREFLLLEMDQNYANGINCQDCPGHCCTSSSNSMQITPLEAMDLILFLKSQNRLTCELKEKLKNCIKEYRLDHEISTTRGIPFRRTYTCPFYHPGPKGCSIEPQYKPFGCLAFNPQKKKDQGNQSCQSNSHSYKKREDAYSMEEEILNGNLIREYNLSWRKKSIPEAILDLWPTNQ
jgi:hypothetical protein